MTVLSVKSSKNHADILVLHSKCQLAFIMSYLLFTEGQFLVTSTTCETYTAATDEDEHPTIRLLLPHMW